MASAPHFAPGAGAILPALMAVMAIGTPAKTQEAVSEGNPRCDLLERGEAGGIDCTLEAESINLFFDYDVTEGSGALTLTQTTPEGGDRRVSDPVAIDGVWATAPGLRDINLDGTNDLFVPTSEGVVNTTFLVWQLDADGYYVPSGEIGGASIEAFENRGELIVATERLNDTALLERAYLLDRDGFIHLYDMRIDLEARACTIVDPGDATGLGLNEDALIAECMERAWE